MDQQPTCEINMQTAEHCTYACTFNVISSEGDSLVTLNMTKLALLIAQLRLAS